MAKYLDETGLAHLWSKIDDMAHTTTALLIGDSYLRTYSGTYDGNAYTNSGWGDFLAEETGWTIIKYKSGGAGWTVQGTSDTETGLTFGGMLSKAYNAMSSVECENVNYVICQGIINDLVNGATEPDILTAVHTFVTNARTWFPNAKIVITNAVCSVQYMGNATLLSVNNSLSSIARRGTIYAIDSYHWFHSLVSNYGRGDDIHPNDNGYHFLARLMARTAMGNGRIFRAVNYSKSAISSIITSQVPTFTDWGSVEEARLSIVNGVAYFFIYIKITNAANLPATNATRVVLPIITLLRATSLAVSPAYCLLTTGYHLNPTAGARICAYSSTVGGSIDIGLLPKSLNADGTEHSYTAGEGIRYEFVVPIGV